MLSTLILSVSITAISAHTAAWAPGMYCLNGAKNTDEKQTNTPVNPLYNLTQSSWWFQHDRGCDAFPPAAGTFLELPAGGSFTVELAHNRAFTSLGFPDSVTDWPDGGVHPEDWNALAEGRECLSDGALHAKDHDTTAGTAFAISYQSELSAVTMDNLVVFTTKSHTPWKRLAIYEVPAALPACGPEGCTCAWLWVPEGCGEPNMYMQGFKCNVTGAVSSNPIAAAKPPVWCRNNATACISGPKQMIAWNQLDGNNVAVPNGMSPGYNANLGWRDGAQNDIFESRLTVEQPSPTTLVTLVAASSTTSSATSTPTSITEEDTTCEG